MSGGPGEPSPHDDVEFTVDVRGPVHRDRPTSRLRRRWADRRRRREREDESSSWLDYLDVPIEIDSFAAVLISIAVLVSLVLIVLAAPFVWILIESVIWLLVAVVSLTAWLIFRRPWSVVILDRSGVEIASTSVRGRRGARAHADVVRRRLNAGATPAVALMFP